MATRYIYKAFGLPMRVQISIEGPGKRGVDAFKHSASQKCRKHYSSGFVEISRLIDTFSCTALHDGCMSRSGHARHDQNKWQGGP